MTMFSPDDIQARVRKQPFTPLRIVTSAGQTFDIHHPDLVMIGRRELTVGRASADHPTQYEQQTRIAIMHLTALEALPTATPPKGNGQQ
jgi:hypothetical protein